MSNLFTKAFLNVLNEEELPAVANDAAGMSDEDAMASTLDDGSSVQDFDIQSGSREASIAAAKAHAAMTDMLSTWLSKINEFITFLNGEQESSVLNILAKADDKSLFGSIKSSESKKIALACKALAELEQMLRLAKHSSQDAKYKGA